MQGAESDKPKTYHLAVGYRKSLYIPVVIFGCFYVFGMISVTVIQYDRAGIWSFQVILGTALVCSYALIGRSRTRLSFYEDHLYYYGIEMMQLLKYRIPWNRVHEIVVEYMPTCKAVIHYTDAKNRRKRAKVPLYIFPDVREIIERLTETAKKRGITLREV